MQLYGNVYNQDNETDEHEKNSNKCTVDKTKKTLDFLISAHLSKGGCMT